MKVVQILYSGLGGHGSVAFSLADAATRAGRWQPAMVFMGIEPTLPAYIASCSAGGYACASIRTQPGRPWASWRALYRALEALRPDAIVLHSVKAILPVALYSRRHSIPLVAVEHQPNALKSNAEWWVSRWLQQLAGAVVVLTPDYEATLERLLGRRWRRDKVHLIPNGIDIELFSPATTAPPRTTRVIGMAARMTKMKRQDLLVDAIAMLRSSGLDWRLSLAGDGETLAALRTQAMSLGLADAVDFPGYLDSAALARWFSSIDAYAHASSGETLSTSLLQALAMGLPIVASNVSGISDLLAQGDGAGVLVEQSPESFADALRHVAGDPRRELELRKRARSLAEAAYSQQAMFQRYDAVLESLCTR